MDSVSFLFDFFYFSFCLVFCRQLSLMLIPVPSSFKLKVFVIDQLDDTMKPFEVEHGQGHYVSTFFKHFGRFCRLFFFKVYFSKCCDK